MADTVAGIGMDEDEAGFKHVIIRPRPGGGLTWAKGSYRSAYGEIKTSWKVEGGRFSLSVTIPANTTGTVYVPGAKGEEIMEGGKPVAEATGVEFLRWEDGAGLYRVRAGEYAFTAGT
jgi:alpha-L-rhamnosidase